MSVVCSRSRSLLIVATIAFGAFGALGLGGCKAHALEAPAPPAFKAKVAAIGDPGQPLALVKISKGDKLIATTGADGTALLSLDGADGEAVETVVQCPDGFKSPEKPLSIRLTRSDKTRAPLFNVSCPPTQRHVVVAVKAENGPNLPVVYLGKVITHTDASGAAHFALDAAPGAQFQVMLDTSGKEGEKLSPLSPAKPFTVGSADDIFVFDQKFAHEKKRVAKGPKVKVATHLGGG